MAKNKGKARVPTTSGQPLSSIPKTDEYMLSCLVEGQSTTFEVEIPPKANVRRLKKAIKKEKEKDLGPYDADTLILFEVNIDLNDHMEDSLSRLDIKEDDEGVEKLKEWKLVEVYWSTQPPTDRLHIFVRLPADAPTGDATSEGKLQSDVISLLESFKPSIQDYLTKKPVLSLWDPTNLPQDMREHIHSLKIPCVSGESHPNLLLHNLGQPSHDQELLVRVSELFTSKLKILYNTSGSGKTRLILEGFWRHWGLYFTARVKDDAIGSHDLSNTLAVLCTELKSPAQQQQNKATALRLFYGLLYSRLLIFRMFIECARDMPGGIQDKHKGEWLLLQLAPTELLNLHQDIFRSLALAASSLLSKYIILEGYCREELTRIHTVLGENPTCAVDEAQIPTKTLPGYFPSSNSPGETRPAVSLLVQAINRSDLSLILSGTGMSLAALRGAVRSSVAEEDLLDETKDIGAFETKEEQQAYFKIYIPKEILEKNDWQVLASRIAYWLRGRHRITARFLSRLLFTGFASPHRVLNQYIHGMTGVWPSDARELVEKEEEIDLKLPPVLSFDFKGIEESFNKEPDFLCQLAGVVFDQTFGVKPRLPINSEAIDRGFARFRSSEGVIDEPLAVLALQKYFKFETKWTPKYFAHIGLTDPYPPKRGDAFEKFITFSVIEAFKTQRPLGEIFKFIGDSSLQNMKAQLVSVSKTGEIFSFIPVGLGDAPSYALGCTMSKEDETLERLTNPSQIAYCFLPKTMGPDAITFLLLSDGTLLRVLWQLKNITKPSLSAVETRDAFRTTDPENLISTRVRDTDQPSRTYRLRDRSKTEKLQAALLSYEHLNAQAGNYSCLRVFCSYPATPDLDTLQQMLEVDHNKHPGATLDFDALLGKGTYANAQLKKLRDDSRCRKRARSE